jgi:hypothetical protein
MLENVETGSVFCQGTLRSRGRMLENAETEFAASEHLDLDEYTP